MKKQKSIWIINRLRKYRRKKFRKSDPQAILYWRYWMKLHQSHSNLWEENFNA